MKFAPITDRLMNLGSDKWTLHFRTRELKAKGEPVIELTIGEPDLTPDRELLEALVSSLYSGRIKYSYGRGEPDTLEAIAKKYTKARGYQVDVENVICFPGTQTAIFTTILGLTEENDSILVGDPYYATYEGLIASTGAKRISVPLKQEHGFRMQASDLEREIREDSRLLLLNNPNNPTGSVLSKEEIQDICRVCEKHDLWILADEVYENLVYEGEFYSPLMEENYRDRIISVASVSKTYGVPGFRSGWAVGPKEFCSHLVPLAETMLFGGVPFIADATAFALNSTSDFVDRMGSSYFHRAKLIVEALAPSNKIKPFLPSSGMFILIDVTGTGMDGEVFAWKLLETEKVAVMPGNSFGKNAASFIRVSLTVEDDLLVEACHRIRSFVQTYG